MHTPRERPRCQICDRAYFNGSTLRKHIRSIHSAPNEARPRFPCEFPNCRKSYRAKCDLSKHVKVHHSKSLARFCCPHCGKEFKFKHHYEQHGVIHSSQKPHSCPTCGKCFKRKCHLRSHLVKILHIIYCHFLN